MGFALCPDDGPPRLWRYIDDDIMTTANMVSMLDKKRNILFINKPVFEKLTDIDKHMALRTQVQFLYA